MDNILNYALAFINYALAFIIAVSILVAVHEFGHYWIARRLGVKILRFSIGFGKPLWTRRFGADQTEFVIAAIPLGGYVKMLDEQEGEVSPEELPRAFNRQSLAVRTAIIAAGPLFNFLFAMLAYTLMFMSGVDGIKPVVGEVTPEGVAERAGLRAGYEIVTVNQNPTLRWESVIQATMRAVLEEKTARYEVRDKKGREYELYMNLDTLEADDFSKGPGIMFKKLGFQMFRPPFPAVIASVEPDGAAKRAGLLAGDKIISMDGQAVSDWHAWAKYVQQHPRQTLVAEIERNGKTISLELIPAEGKNGKGYMGVGGKPAKWPEEYRVAEQYGVVDAIGMGVSETWGTTTLLLRFIGKLLSWQVSAKSISGPLTIAQVASYAFEAGWSSALKLLAFVSVSLAVLNLLPIPVLDGGHLLVYLLEWIKGKPVSETVLSIMYRVGLTLLLLLMGLAFYNDLNRIF
ncbi:MAG: RIP metalloprotease RseP [Gammaproteobacteria bacterium]|nr:RIP metalloprotease RseP [Gammaproteobacteria bacterium]